MPFRGIIAGVLLLVLIPSPGEVAGQDGVLRRIAFGSCAHQDKPQPIWEPIVAIKPDLFLFVGDNIYGDTKDMAVMKGKYAQLGAEPGYKKLVSSCPVLATWDDHDFGANDAGADYPQKAESQQVFLDFFGIAKDSPRRKQEGVYHAQVFGPADKSVQVILLDTRYFRGPLKKKAKFIPSEGGYLPNPDPTSTMLGDAQWKWLEEQLRVPAKVRLLVSSVQTVAEDHGHEKWMNLPLERDRLYKLIRDTKAAGVVILSGDRHLAELSLMDAGIGYPLYDLTSSGLNQGFPRWRKLEVNRHRVATMNHGNNFGLVTIDWDKSDPVIRLQIRDEQGDITIQEKLALSMLQPGAIKGKGSGLVKLASGAALTPSEVTKHLNTKVTIEMEVHATGTSPTQGLVFLNSATDRTSEDNFTVVLDKKAQADLAKAGISQPRTHFEGKTIRVTGTLTLFRERPQIIVSEGSQIQVITK